MTVWLIVFGALYTCGLAYSAAVGRRDVSQGPRAQLMAGRGVGTFLGFMTFSATLFSTFTLMGMPDFVRTHGVGGWIFLGVTDVAVAFVALWFGLRLREHVADRGFLSVSNIVARRAGGRFASFVYLACVSIFLLPYVAIQINGIVLFLASILPGDPSPVLLTGVLLVAILAYSTVGGLRAIIYSDAIQGTVLLVVVWLVALTLISASGGVSDLVSQAAASNEALMSTPGPAALLTNQFLVASFLAIVLMPLSQPQLTVRLAVLKSNADLRLMAVALGIFAIVVILPTVLIGLYGAANYSALSAPQFWSRVLVADQHHVVAAAVIIGLVAAAMSTADSQLYALGTEVASTVARTEQRVLLTQRLVVLIYAGLAASLALVSSDQLVLLARVSFAGTALIAPMVLAAVAARARLGPEVPVLSLGATVLFLLQILGFLPGTVLGARVDLVLLLFVSAGVWLSTVVRGSR